MEEKINFKGHITVLAIDKDGNIVDKWLDDNLIMDKARVNMSEIISGMSTGAYINKFVLGTEGHNVDYLIPKTSAQGFTSTRTQLFSEESAGFTYPIVFNTTGVSGDFTLVSEPDTAGATNINVVQSGTDVTYTIDIPATNANGTGTVVYTEAALYAGVDIFSMKCFSGKIKDNSVSLRIIWKLLF